MKQFALGPFVGVLVGLLFCSAAVAAGQARNPFGAKEWFLLGGFGQSHPGWGNTHQKVKTTDIILRQKRPQTPIRGHGKYRYQRSMLLEIPLHILRSPDEPPIFGITFNACWTFVGRKSFQPYVYAGGGPAFTRASIPGTSSEIRGTYQAGVGLEMEKNGRKYIIDIRFHHMSNGGIEKPNDSLNSTKLLFGVQLGQ